MSDAILVLGIYGSGASAVAGTLMRLGAVDGEQGCFESVPFRHFHDQLLESAGSSWKDWRAFNAGWRRSPVAPDFRRRAKELFLEEFGGSSFAILRDPRICRFAPFWFDVLREMEAEPRVVIPVRAPLDVARSVSATMGLSLAHGLLLWLRYVLDAEAQSREELRSIFTWPDFRADWRGVCEKIAAETHLEWLRPSDWAARGVERFLAKETIRFDDEPAIVAARGDAHEWTLRVHEALLELARDPLSNSALATLDEIRALLDQSSTIFGRLLVDYEVDLEEARDRANAAQRDRDAIHARAGENSAELSARADLAERARDEAVRDSQTVSIALSHALAEQAGLQAELRSGREELRQKTSAMDELSARAERAERERDELQAKLSALTAELRSRVRELGELSARAEATERAREELGREMQSLARAHSMAIDERDALGQTRSALEAELQSRQQELDGKTTALAELSIRVQQAELRCDDLARQNRALNRSLADSNAEHANSRREAAEAARRRADSLATRLEQTSSELKCAQERAAQQQAAQTQAQKSHDAVIESFRSQLVDAEAAFSRAQAKAARRGLLSWPTPAAATRKVAKRLLSSGLFDVEFYRAQHPGDGDALAAAEHYVEEGFSKGYRPNALFDTRWYLTRYADVRRSGVNPLLHYLAHGVEDGRDPGPNFQTSYYLEVNPDVRANGSNPLLHYLRHGRQEGRSPVRPAPEEAIDGSSSGISGAKDS